MKYSLDNMNMHIKWKPTGMSRSDLLVLQTVQHGSIKKSFQSRQIFY